MASAADKLKSVDKVPEPADISYAVDMTIWTYSLQGQNIYNWYVGDITDDLRLYLDSQQASTIEIDLDDGDFTLLDHPIFAHWAFDIEDVSQSATKASSKTKQFTPTTHLNSIDTTYLGDSANLEWVLGQRPIDFQLGDVAFRLCGLQTQQTTLTLTFEDRAASFLRDQSGFKSVKRGTYTRAQFVAMLCREAGVESWIPELTVQQPVAVDTSSGASKKSTGNGISSAANLTVKGFPATPLQKQYAETIITYGRGIPASDIAIGAILVEAIAESGLGEPAYMGWNASNPAYGGLLAGNISSANGGGNFGPLGGASSQAVTLAEIQAAFHGTRGYHGGAISLSKSSSDLLQIAMTNSGSGTQFLAEAGHDQWAAEARKFISAYGGPGATGSLGVATSPKSYSFTRGPNEDSWDCIQRLASEVAWYAFVRDNRLWFVSGDYLFSQDSQLTLERGKSGVDYIDLDLDMGARDQVAEVNVTARASLWAGLPGMVCEVVKRGPATGKWFISSLTSHPLDVSQAAQITLQKPVPPRAEPSATSSSSSSSPKSLATTASGNKGVDAVYAEALKISKMNMPYVWGGGHSTIGVPNGSPPGYDCSGYVSACVHAAGWLSSPLVSGGFESWGVAGPGKLMTVWCSSDHVFIEFKLPAPIGHVQANTSPGPGPHVIPWGSNGQADAQSGGFTARHWPGT